MEYTSLKNFSGHCVYTYKETKTKPSWVLQLNLSRYACVSSVSIFFKKSSISRLVTSFVKSLYKHPSDTRWKCENSNEYDISEFGMLNPVALYIISNKSTYNLMATS